MATVYADTSMVRFMMIELCGIEEYKVDRFIRMNPNTICYIGSKLTEYNDLIKEYKKLKKAKYDDKEVVNILSKRFQKSKRRLKEIIERYKQGKLPLYES